MAYRLELILGQGISSEQFQAFLDSLSEVSPALRSVPQAATLWQQQARQGGSSICFREFDDAAWALEGTLLFVALVRLAGQPYATAWQMIGQAATHPDCGMRLLQLTPGGQAEVFRLP